jgi:uncharacterized protein (TIGR03083 family)
VSDTSWLGPPIEVRALFAGQQAAFLDLLRGFGTQDWDRPTVCPGWSVKDVAAHVLGDHIGRLSTHVLQPGEGEAFPAFINRINAEWVTGARRIGPAVLVDLLTHVGDQVARFWQGVDMDAGGVPVSWAGPRPAPVWLDAARDFSEYWTHHQQIAEATGRDGLTTPEYLGPVLDTFLRALPHTLRDVDRPAGTALEVTVTGPAGGSWTCRRDHGRWTLDRRPHPNPDARLTLDPDTTWRLCTRGITPAQAAAHAHTDGDPRITGTALGIVSIIW